MAGYIKDSFGNSAEIIDKFSRDQIQTLQQELSGKMEFYKVNLAGGVGTYHFTHTNEDGSVDNLNYADLKEKYLDDKYFLFCEWRSVTFIPSLPPDYDPTYGSEVIEFSAVWDYLGEHRITVIKINSDGQIKADEYEDDFLIADKTYVNDYVATHGGGTGETKFIFTKNPKANANGTLIYGQCVIALGEKTGLFDLGMDESMTSVINMLNANNVTKIDYIVISHYHTDHSTNDVVTAVRNLANAFDLSHCMFYLPHKGIDWSKFTSGSENKQSTETALVSELTAKGYNFVKADASTMYDIDGSTSVEFYNVGPYPDDFYNYKLDQNQQANNKNGTVQTNYNAFAMLCMIHDHGKNILITSDATWNALDAVANVGNCDVMTIEHHGLERKSSEKFYERIRPSVGIVFNYSENHNTDELRYIPSVLKVSRTASIYDNINNDVVVTVSAGGFDVDGDAVDVNYSAQHEFDSACLLDVVNSNLSLNGSVAITGNNQYFEMNGAFVQIGKNVYFKAIGTYKKNVNNGSGVGIASNLPIPNDKNIRFVFKNELGEEAYSHMFYESGWRTNGTEVAGNRRFIVGCYEAETESTFTTNIMSAKQLTDALGNAEALANAVSEVVG